MGRIRKVRSYRDDDASRIGGIDDIDQIRADFSNSTAWRRQAHLTATEGLGDGQSVTLVQAWIGRQPGMAVKGLQAAVIDAPQSDDLAALGLLSHHHAREHHQATLPTSTK